MEVLYFNIVSNIKKNQFKYVIDGEKITATLKNDEGEETDVFDFTGMPDGVLSNVETSLTVNPILKAEKIDGVLYVTLINFLEG